MVIPDSEILCGELKQYQSDGLPVFWDRELRYVLVELKIQGGKK